MAATISQYDYLGYLDDISENKGQTSSENRVCSGVPLLSVDNITTSSSETLSGDALSHLSQNQTLCTCEGFPSCIQDNETAAEALELDGLPNITDDDESLDISDHVLTSRTEDLKTVDLLGDEFACGISDNHIFDIQNYSSFSNLGNDGGLSTHSIVNDKPLYLQSCVIKEKDRTLDLPSSLSVDLLEDNGTLDLPHFESLCEDTTVSADDCGLNITGLIRNDKHFNMPLIEELQQLMFEDTHAEDNNQKEFVEKSVMDVMKEVKNEIASINNETCSGSAESFSVSCNKQPVRNKSEKAVSKAARKRKKQQQKLQKLAVQCNPASLDNTRRRFARSYEELRKSTIVYELERDVDPRLSCPVCLEMYHLPSTCHPCGHVFCDLCLRRLTGRGSEGVPCPLCRTIIASCELDRDFDEQLILLHPDIYTARSMSERRTRFRHFPLPYTPPLPLGKRIMRQLAASRNNQSDSLWMSHDWFKFLLGCTAGMCLSLLIMLLNRVKSVHDVRDVNIAFLSILVGASVTYMIFIYFKI